MKFFWKRRFSANFFLWEFSEYLFFHAPSGGRFWKTAQQSSFFKPRKVSKDLKKIFTCAPQNGCSEIIRKAQGKCSCCSPVSLVSETLPCDYIKMGLYGWYYCRNAPTFFLTRCFSKHLWTTDSAKVVIYLVSQKIIAASGLRKDNLLKCNKTDLEVLVKSHKGLKRTESFSRSYSTKNFYKISQNLRKTVMDWIIMRLKPVAFWNRAPSLVFSYDLFRAATFKKTASEGIACKPKRESKWSHHQLY